MWLLACKTTLKLNKCNESRRKPTLLKWPETLICYPWAAIVFSCLHAEALQSKQPNCCLYHKHGTNKKCLVQSILYTKLQTAKNPHLHSVIGKHKFYHYILTIFFLVILIVQRYLSSSLKARSGSQSNCELKPYYFWSFLKTNHSYFFLLLVSLQQSNHYNTRISELTTMPKPSESNSNMQNPMINWDCNILIW